MITEPRAVQTHELKTWPAVFWNTVQRIKTFEYRKNDRDFRLGDRLLLREYDPDRDVYSGQAILVYVSYILYGPDYGIPEGYCVMSVKPVSGAHYYPRSEMQP